MERQRTSLLNRLESFAAEQLAFRPGAGAWSVAEVVHHLVLVEEAFVRQSGLDASKRPATPGMRAGAAYLAVIAVLRTGLRVKAPSKAVVPTGAVPLADSRGRWAATRADLRAFLETVSAPVLRRAVFKHPLAGWLTVPQGLGFLEVHVDHHLRQIARIERAPGFVALSARTASPT